MANTNEPQRYRLTHGEQILALTQLQKADFLAWKAYRLCRRTVPLEELQSVARFALASAASRFEESRGPFAVFATTVIRRWLIREINFWTRDVRLHVLRFSELSTPQASDAPVYNDVPCPRAADSIRVMEATELMERLRQLLPAEWFRLLQLYFVEGHTFEEIGRLMGVSRERVRLLIVTAGERARQLFPYLGPD